MKNLKIHILLLFVTILIKGNAQNYFDHDFGSDGIHDFSYIDGNIRGIKFQGENKIIVPIGWSDENSNDFRVVCRMNLDGTIDESFGNNGFFADDPTLMNSINSFEDFAIDESGDIYMASASMFANTDYYQLTVTKITADGNLDVSFGNNGYALIGEVEGSESTKGNSVVIDNNGNLIISGGYIDDMSGKNQLMIAKFLNDGTLDLNFGNNGVFIFPDIDDEYQLMSEVFITPDNSTMFSGTFTTPQKYKTALIKLTPDGQFDGTFGDNGVFKTDDTHDFYGCTGLLLDDGSIVLAGSDKTDNAMSDATILKITENGILDTSFGTNGYSHSLTGTSSNATDISSTYYDILIHNNQIVLSGEIMDFLSSDCEALFSRVNMDGSFDNGYGENGSMFFLHNDMFNKQFRSLTFINKNNEFYFAGNSINNIWESNAFIAKLLGSALIPPPSNLTYEMSGNDVVLNWEAPNSNGLTGYKVYHSYESSAEFVLFEDVVGNTTCTHSAPEIGNHQYYVTAIYDDVESTSTDTVDVVILGLDEALENHLQIYPNPAKDFVCIETSLTALNVQLINLAGQLITEQTITENKLVINTTQFEPGVYFIKVFSHDNAIIKKLVVE